MKCGPGRRKRRHEQREGILPAFLIPAAIAAAKAAAAGAGAISARQGLVGRWSVDPMDADNAMSPTTPATWIATWRRATYVDDGSLALGGQNTPTAGAPTLRGDPKEKPSPLR